MKKSDQTSQPRNPHTSRRKDPPPLRPADIDSVMRQTAVEAQSSTQAVSEPVTEVLADWVAPQYLASIYTQLSGLPMGAERHELLRQAVGDAVALQRGHRWDARVQLDREKFAFAQKKRRDLTPL